MFVCLCRAVSDRTIRAAIRAGAVTVPAVGDACGAATACGKCATTVEMMILTETQQLVGPRGPNAEERR